MAEQLLVKNYTAGEDIPKARFVKFTGVGDAKLVELADSTDKIVGISDRTPALVDDGDRVDVVHVGETELELGGTVTSGDRLAAGTDGVGVASTSEVPGIACAVARQDGVDGDIIKVFLRL